MSLSRVLSLDLPDGVSRRIDCVWCGGRGTLSVSKRNGEVLWNCFRASCGKSGRRGSALTAADIRHRLGTQERERGFALPPHLLPVTASAKALAWLRKFNAIGAVADGSAECRYDPAEDRVVFLIKNHGVPVDAAGRSLRGETPKWRRYGASGYPLIIAPHGNATCAVVEDAASACAVSRWVTGVALLGTHIPDSYLPTLSRFRRCLIALDPDAKIKALKLERQLSAVLPCRVLFLPADPKNMTPQELQRRLIDALGDSDEAARHCTD